MTFKYRYRKQITIVMITLLVIGSIITYWYFFQNKKNENKKEKNILTEHKVHKKTKEKIIEDENKEIMVDVKGEVVNSGIYTLKEGSRVIDAIQMAGGVTQNGDTSVLNLSKKLTDEMVIIVYSYYEVRNLEKVKEVEQTVRENCVMGNNGVQNDACIENSISDSNDNTSGKVSINTATLEELMTLSGIGEAKAKSIIEYRDQNGGFNSLDELKEVSGIGDSLFDKIKENITL